jgi:hypothetical protein
MATVSSSTATAAPLRPESPASPPARRLDRRRLKDPRLWVGLMLVAGSVLVGGRALAAADDTVGVWTLNRDVPAGQRIGPDVLELEQVHFADAGVSQGYWLDAEAPPETAVAARDLAAGELLARSAVSSDRETPDLSQLPVVVGAAGAPADLHTGDVVDVWVVPAQRPNGETGPATQVLDEVRVASTTRESGPLGEAANRQVLLGVDEQSADHLGGLLTSVSTGTVVLIRSGQ